MHQRSRTAPVLAAALAAGLFAAVPAHAAPSASPHGRSDVNGDGYGDLVTASEATVAGLAHAGAIVVNTGSADGISAKRVQIVTQNSAGVPGAAEKGDLFGSVLATADLNDDGYTDVVAGTPAEDVDGDVDGGTVAVLWGTKSGLGSGTTLPDPAPSAHDRFGDRLAVGDFNGDGQPELAVGTDSNDVWIFEGVSSAGATGKRRLDTAVAADGPDYYRSLAAGDFDGDGTDDLVVGGRYDEDNSFDGAALVYPGAAGAYTVLPDEAHVAAAGDFDGDGRDDLVTGSPDDNSITAYRGGAQGLAASSRTTLTQDSPGVPGVTEQEDSFGDAVAVGDVNRDGYADVVVGDDFEAIGTVQNAGEVVVLHGSAAGLTGTGAQVVHQGTEGVPGANETYDRFGATVRLTDTDRDGYDDLAAAAPTENTSNGALWSLHGSSGGVSAGKAVSFSAATAGLSQEPYQYFGQSMPTSTYGS
ncbi:FG-GAP and VCBS repeat-containing protein [Streptomyces sp. NPDC059740]|uniref:FG-GAP and VCBS repeat-containing protein n=1 Tax=Streptomyces sp. NPDC059740 TaxID=3346926 RepID=UPI00365D3A45